MAEKKKFYIRIPDALVEVSKEVYQAYHQEDRRAKTLEEKDARNGKVLYSDLDTPELSGEEMVPDRESASVENTAVASILRDKLHHCLAQLPQSDRKLIQALYFEGLSERQLAQRSGIHHMTIHSRKASILRRLKKSMEN